MLPAPPYVCTFSGEPSGEVLGSSAGREGWHGHLLPERTWSETQKQGWSCKSCCSLCSPPPREFRLSGGQEGRAGGAPAPRAGAGGAGPHLLPSPAGGGRGCAQPPGHPRPGAGRGGLKPPPGRGKPAAGTSRRSPSWTSQGYEEGREKEGGIALQHYWLRGRAGVRWGSQSMPIGGV